MPWKRQGAGSSAGFRPHRLARAAIRAAAVLALVSAAAIARARPPHRATASGAENNRMPRRYGVIMDAGSTGQSSVPG